jgi:hypothetical protein
MKRIIPPALAAFFLLALPASGRPQDALTWQQFGFGQQDYIVEQETNYPQGSDPAGWVVNTTSCAWSVNDHWLRALVDGGQDGVTLDAHGSSATSVCMIASPNPFYKTINGVAAYYSYPLLPYLSVSVSSPSPSLTAAACWSPQNRCFNLTPTWNAAAHDYEASLCALASYSPSDPALQTIPDSNGGSGVYSTVSITVANPTSRAVRKVYAAYSILGADAGNPTCNANSEYPFHWSSS